MALVVGILGCHVTTASDSTLTHASTSVTFSLIHLHSNCKRVRPLIVQTPTPQQKKKKRKREKQSLSVKWTQTLCKLYFYSIIPNLSFTSLLSLFFLFYINAALNLKPSLFLQGRNMCYPHPGLHLIDSYHCETRRGSLRNFVSHVGTAAVETVVSQNQPTSGMVPSRGREGAASTGKVMKQCLCSPTRHPGSFRCRHHHAGYIWVGRQSSK